MLWISYDRMPLGLSMGLVHRVSTVHPGSITSKLVDHPNSPAPKPLLQWHRSGLELSVRLLGPNLTADFERPNSSITGKAVMLLQCDRP